MDVLALQSRLTVKEGSQLKILSICGLKKEQLKLKCEELSRNKHK